MKKLAIRFSFTSLFAIVVLLYIGCASQDIAGPKRTDPLPPRIQHVRTNHTLTSFESAELYFYFSIENPGKRPLQLHSYRYSLEHNNTTLTASDNKLEGITVAGQSSYEIEVPVTVALGSPEPASTNNETASVLPYKMQLEIMTAKNVQSSESPEGSGIQNSEGGMHQMHYSLTSHTEGTLILPQLPRLSIPEVIIRQFEHRIIRIEYMVEIENANPFPIELSPAVFTFTVGSTQWDKNNLPAVPEIAAHKKKTTAIEIRMNYLEAGRETVDILIGDKTLDYRLAGDTSARLFRPVRHIESETQSENSAHINSENEFYSFSFATEGTSKIIRP